MANLLGLMLVFAGLETILRLIGWTDTGSPYPAHSTVIHTNSEYHVSYRYNDRGFREEFDFRPLEQVQASRPDVITIGDSFTEGFGVAANETFSADLERILQSRNPAARVLNLGVSGTGPNDYARVFAYALRLRPRSVIIGFFVGNDATEARAPHPSSRWRAVQFIDEKIRIGRRLLNPNPFQSGIVASAYRWWVCRNAGITVDEFWRRHHHMSPEIQQLLASQSVNFHLVLLALLQPATIYNNLALADPQSSEGIHHAFAIFSAMQQECARRGIQFHVAAIPASVQVSPRYQTLLAAMGFTKLESTLGESALERNAAQLAKSAGINFVDFIEPLSDFGRDRYYYPIDSHLTPAGHRRLAEAIAAQFFSSPAP